MTLQNDRFTLQPDSLTGAVAAIEGIQDAAVLLNGPTGCKFYHGAMSENQLQRVAFIDPMYYSEEFYFGQPRVPATYLDDYDYVFGATEKLEKILPVVAAKNHKLIAVINTPGAALIGDDLQRFINKSALPVPCIAIENTGFSKPPSYGYCHALEVLLQNVEQVPAEKKNKSVNLAGISILHHHWQGNVQELQALLGCCSIEVNTVISAGCTLAELQNLAAAQATLILHDEFGGELTALLEEQLDQQCIASPMGAPVGFDATEQWISMVCQQLDTDPAPALHRIQEQRLQAYDSLNRFNALTGLPKGAGCGVQGDASFVLPLVQWLHSYLGMVPLALELTDGTDQMVDTLKQYLATIGCRESLHLDITQTQPEVVFGSGALLSRMRLLPKPFIGIETALPVRGYHHVIPKKTMGAGGALYLIEQIINGLAGW